ncbi:transmembrane protein 52B-like isoform X2 [Scyliorhinus torazame]|uniref:transmembrane protein 52B-like isoform X2 n=1 Tax=Scyliorhinus torazame TaxID=75743 RepID=UPI003B5CBEE0
MELLPRAAILIYSLSILCQLVGVRSDDDECVSSEHCSNLESHLTSLWYVWLLLVLSLLLVLCGILTSCLRCCGRRQQEAGVLSPRPYEVTVITLDQDNTIHSTIQNTITSIQSLFAPSARRIFTVTRCHNAAPAHENPPGYEEALERVEVPKLPEGGAGLRGMMEAAR